MEPECVRLHGELTLHASNPDTETAERSFREAITIAEAHTAKSWELRAAMSLARLLYGPRTGTRKPSPALNRSWTGSLKG